MKNLRSALGSGGLLIASLLVCGAAILVAAWFYYHRQRETLDAAAIGQLRAIADFKSEQIANWRRERIAHGHVLAISLLMRSAERLLANQATGSERSDITRIMEQVSHYALYSDISLVDLDGNVVVQLRQDRRAADKAMQPTLRDAARDAVKARDVVLSDLIQVPPSGRPFMLLSVPVGELGAFILEIDPESFLYPYLRTWPVASRTADTILLRRESPTTVLALSPVRGLPGSEMTVRSEVKQPAPDESALAAGWATISTDYQGHSALGVVRKIPDSPWYLSARIDRSEVEAPLAPLGWGMALIAVLIGLANAAGVGLIWRDRELRALREREEWFFSIANDTPAYLWMSAPELDNSFINEPLRKFLGFDGQMLASDWLACVHPDERAAARTSYLENLAAHREFTAEARIRRFDGVYRNIISQGIPRFSPAHQFLGFAGSMVDITEVREAEEDLRSANQALAHELQERTRAEQEVHALSARLIDAQEQERTRLARELHDDLSQQVAALSMGLSHLRRKLQGYSEALGESLRIQDKLSQLAESMRRLSHELHPSVLQHSGLAPALENYCTELAALTSHRIDFRSEGAWDALSPDAALCLYRIAQEALQNSIKHSGVSTAEVALERTGGEVRLIVSDRGIGMDPAATGGLGLVSMKERVRLVNGTIELISRPGQGVTMTAHVPVLAEAATPADVSPL